MSNEKPLVIISRVPVRCIDCPGWVVTDVSVVKSFNRYNIVSCNYCGTDYRRLQEPRQTKDDAVMAAEERRNFLDGLNNIFDKMWVF